MRSSHEKRKYLIAIILIEILLVVTAICVTTWQYRAYTQNYNKKLNSLIGIIKEEYEDLETYEIIETLNQNQGKDKSQPDYVSKYGIDIKTDSILLENDKRYKEFLLVNIGIMIALSIVIIGYFLNRINATSKTISKITKIMENINNGDYSFDMNAISENDISLLENEVYKTTIMLKENADISKQEKQSLKDSLSDISHQLKTSLTSLSINLENLYDEPDLKESDKKRLLSNSKRDVGRINQMVQKLLILSKFDANVVSFTPKNNNLKELTNEALSDLEALADLLDISIVVEDAIDKDMDICCDGYWQKEAISNIIKNGIEHANGKVSISFNDCKLYKEIIIENDGENISNEDIKNIFKRFYKGQNSSKNSVGIGLALADAIVRHDGGYIVAENTNPPATPGVKFTIRYIL